MANFPNIIDLRTACIPVAPPPPDSRCSDPIFALLHPDICANSPFLRIKPGLLLTCRLGSVQFSAFTEQSNLETAVTSGVVWSSSDPTVAVIGVNSGNATGVAPGTVTITATYQGLTATATFSVLAGTGHGASCCGTETVATMLVVDKSHSMSLQFGSGYSTKQAFADSLASNYASQTNTQKDVIGLIEFDTAPVTDASLTSAAATVAASAFGIVNSVNKTSLGTALQAAVLALSTSQADVKVIVLITDGEDNDPANDPVPVATAFRATGGVILCVGVRAHGTAFNLLNVLCTGGFFVNCYPSVVQDAINTVYGLKGYLCAGNCAPAGNVTVPTPKAQYNLWTNWTIQNLTGDYGLYGPGYFDLLPSNGQYVALSASAGAFTSKSLFSLVPGHTYRLSFSMAGNQLFDIGTQTLLATIGSQFSKASQVADFEQQFVKYSYNFTVAVAASAPIQFTVQPVADSVTFPVSGGKTMVESDNLIPLLLDNVSLDDLTTGLNLFADNFDGENETYIPPACGTVGVYVPSSNCTCSDSDANAFIAAAGILDCTQINAICALVTGLKAASLWNSFDAIYPFVGGNSVAHAVNLKNPAKYGITWHGGVVHNASGITGDGATGYGDTGFNPTTATAPNFTQNSASIGAYCGTNSSASGILIGLSSGGFIQQNAAVGFGSPNGRYDGLNNSASSSHASATLKGNWALSRTLSNSETFYAPDGTNVADSNATTGLANASFFVLAVNEFGAGQTLFCIQTVSLAWIASGFTGGQITTANNLFTQYETTLGRA